jgi:hypothetical protein
MEIMLFENFNDIDIRDVAWLYFLAVIYGGKMKAESWEKDERMNGRNFAESMNKFPDLVYKENGYYYSKKEAFKIIDKFFKKSLERSTYIYQKGQKIDTASPFNDRRYSIYRIPYEYYMQTHKKISKDFDKINNLIIDHFNSQSVYTHIIDKILKVKNLDKFNFVKYVMEFPNKPPKIKVYRGIKSKYMERKTGYSAWTTSKNQAERFAKYHFTGGYQAKPIHSDISYLLEAEISFSDIKVYIGGDEKEIILKNPVNNIKVIDISKDK